MPSHSTKSASASEDSSKKAIPTTNRALSSLDPNPNPENSIPADTSDDFKIRWIEGLPATEAYYDDEEIPVARLIAQGSGFPPKGIDMVDAWLVKIPESEPTGRARGIRYPVVCDSKGGLRNTYRHKGRAVGQQNVGLPTTNAMCI